MKPIAFAAALALLAANLAAPAQDNSPAPRVSIEIGMLSLSSVNGAEAWFEQEIAAFQTAHPDIGITTLAIASPNKRERNVINMPALARNIVGINSLQGGEAAWLASRGHIVPIDKFLPDPELSLDEFPPNLFGAVKFDGKIWAIPWSTEHIVFACNWPLFQEAGIAEPPKTWDEFADYAQRLTKDNNGDGQTDQWGVCAVSYDMFGYLAVTLLMQKDTRVFNKNGIDLSSPRVPEAFGLIQNWMEAGVVSENPNAAMWIGRKEHVQNISQDFRFAPLPTWGRDVVCTNETDFLAIRKSTPEEEAASWEFIKWMSRKDVSMPPRWAGYPCRIDFAKRPDFLAVAANYGGTLPLLYTQNMRACEPAPANLVNQHAALKHVLGFLRRAMAGEGDYQTILTTAAIEANQLIQVIPDPADLAANLYK